MSARTIRWSEALRAQMLLLYRMGRVRVLVWAGVLSLVLAGAAWGIMLWWHEPPGRRDHFLAAPVDVTAHEITRIDAGGVWLLVVLLFTTAAGLAVQVVASGRVAAFGSIAPEAWAALFSAPLLAYVSGSHHIHRDPAQHRAGRCRRCRTDRSVHAGRAIYLGEVGRERGSALRG